MATTPIVQFGTSRFLQAHADLFISQALENGDALGAITIVQSSGDAKRAERLRALASSTGYPVKIRGLQNGQIVDAELRVNSVRRALSTAADLKEVTRIIVEEAEIILSNTADAGYRPHPSDASDAFDQSMSYPAKLTMLLLERFKANARPIQVMPTELISANGETLAALVQTIGRRHSDEFHAWLQKKVLWVNSLVDRIVSEPLEPAGAVAEPYALWAVEKQPGLVLPCAHPAIKLVDDLQDIETLKLFILNLSHTYLVCRWREKPDCGHQYVRELMNDETFRADLESLYAQEIIPAFQSYGRGEEAKAYCATTLERFANPFLDHKLSDIAQNHEEKINRRIGGFLEWSQKAAHPTRTPRLRAIV